MPLNLDELARLVAQSASLSEVDKRRIIAALPQLTAEQCAELEQAMALEQEQLRALDAGFQEGARRLNEQYEQAVQTFQCDVLPAIRQKAEARERTSDQSTADDLFSFP